MTQSAYSPNANMCINITNAPAAKNINKVAMLRRWRHRNHAANNGTAKANPMT